MKLDGRVSDHRKGKAQLRQLSSRCFDRPLIPVPNQKAETASLRIETVTYRSADQQPVFRFHQFNANHVCPPFPACFTSQRVTPIIPSPNHTSNFEERMQITKESVASWYFFLGVFFTLFSRDSQHGTSWGYALAGVTCLIISAWFCHVYFRESPATGKTEKADTLE